MFYVDVNGNDFIQMVVVHSVDNYELYGLINVQTHFDRVL